MSVGYPGATDWMEFLIIFVALFMISVGGYALGWQVKDRPPENNPYYLPDAIPSTILGVLALFLGFTFSMSNGRFENRRQLVIQEANAIGTVYLRTSLLRQPGAAELESLLRRYLDSRIEFYESASEPERLKAVEVKTSELQSQIWRVVDRVIRRDRGAIESNYVIAMNQMFDLEATRTIALRKTLPLTIYASILVISALGLAAMNFARAQRRERGHWQSGILVLVVAFVVTLLLDLERPKAGTIRITQEAMTDLRDSWILKR